jgi:peptidyl-prolyl cis-trans isomerase C
MDMSFFRTAFLLCPAACLLAQTPPPANRQATPVPASTQQQAQPPAGGRTTNPDGSVTMQVPIGAAPAQVPPDKVVLTVGDLALTAKQLDDITAGMPDQYKAFFRGPGRKQFADQVIVRVLAMAQEGKRRKLDQKPEYQTQVMFQSDQVLANMTLQALQSEIKIDDADLQKYYDAHKADYEQVHARHILIRFQGSPVPVKSGSKDLTDSEALAKAMDLEEQLKAGADFNKLAGAESDDTGAAANGGDLGTFGRGKMVGPFEQAAFKMQAGQVSDPVKSQFGYHIIKVESIENKTFDQVKGEIEKKVRPEKTNQAMDEIQKSVKVVYDPVYFGMPTPSPLQNLTPGK